MFAQRLDYSSWGALLSGFGDQDQDIGVWGFRDFGLPEVFCNMVSEASTWVVISRVIGLITLLIITLFGVLITLLITTHEPPSRGGVVTAVRGKIDECPFARFLGQGNPSPQERSKDRVQGLGFRA